MPIDRTNPRFAPFVWPSLLGPLIAGDASCVWAGWYKAHFQYAKRPDPSFDLERWKAAHADAVRNIVAGWRDEFPGARVLTEAQTKWKLRGQTGIEMSGACDALLVPAEPTEPGLVGDVKTGKRKGGDVWQLKLYMDMVPRAKTSGPLHSAAARTLDGVLFYRDGSLIIPASQLTTDDRARIHAMIRTLGGPEEPATRTPSAFECGRCDIDCCPDRIEKPASEPIDETDAF